MDDAGDRRQGRLYRWPPTRAAQDAARQGSHTENRQAATKARSFGTDYGGIRPDGRLCRCALAKAAPDAARQGGPRESLGPS
jgi:hypothetical protein